MIDLKNARTFGPAAVSADQRIETLERIALDLMMEVESLRAAVLGLSRGHPADQTEEALAHDPGGVPGPHTEYGHAYLETAWRSHWSAGTSSGADKLLELFYPTGSDMREILFLRRLGYSEVQIRKYVESVHEAVTCT